MALSPSFWAITPPTVFLLEQNFSKFYILQGSDSKNPATSGNLLTYIQPCCHETPTESHNIKSLHCSFHYPVCLHCNIKTVWVACVSTCFKQISADRRNGSCSCRIHSRRRVNDCLPVGLWQNATNRTVWFFDIDDCVYRIHCLYVGCGTLPAVLVRWNYHRLKLGTTPAF